MRRPHIYIYATLFALAAALLAPHPLTALMAVATTALWGGVATAVDIRPQVALGAV